MIQIIRELQERAKKEYEQSIHTYTLLFCQKHGFDIDDCYWANDDIGQVLCVADYYFNFSEIKYDLDNYVKEDMLISWYNYSLEAHEKGEPTINYSSYTKII